MSTPPKALFKVIANGNSKAGDKLYLTLVATPAGDAQNLREWPKLIREMFAADMLAQANQLTVQVQVQGHDYLETVTATPRHPDAYRKGADKAWSHVYALWKDAFVGRKATSADLPEQVFTELAADILKSLEGKKRAVNVGGSGELQPPNLHLNGDIKGKLHAADSKEQIMGILSVQQTHDVNQDQAIRAARILKKLHRGPDWFVDSVEVGDESSSEAVVTNNLAESAHQRTDTRIKELISGTKPQRDFGLACFTAIENALDGTASALSFPEQPKLLPAENLDTWVDRSTHEYYTLAQRNEKFQSGVQHGSDLQNRPERSMKTSTEARPGEGDARHKLFDNDAPGKLLETARAAFYALQGDPILSRLFGLAIDIEIDTSKLPPPANDISNSAIDHILHFSVPSSFGTIGTAARLKKNDSRVSFWPVSIFDALRTQSTGVSQDVDNRLDLLAEQRHGLFRVGQFLPGDGPRYHVSSLDARYATETKVKTTHHAARAKPRDRGELLPSGGLLVLDRGRTIQVARDLALYKWDKGRTSKPASFAGAPKGWRMLYAEQLTIGRRADIAVARRDVHADKLHWRSLMRRATNFDFGANDKDIEKLLRLMLPGNGNDALSEEVYFQNAVRQLPVKSSKVEEQNKDGIEAVCEEIVFHWSGTPKGVDVNGSKVLSSALPFERTLTLPQGQSSGKLRPPPLRFGTPYVLRFRAVYIGGGSPGDEVADAVTSGNTEYVLPGKPGKRSKPDEILPVSPRRFLRHEAIRQPTLLLPHHLAAKKLGADGRMGFERLEHAIVRSEAPPQAPIDEATVEAQERQDKNVIRGKYVTPAERAVPLQTMRIVVPPEAAPELVERHGAFDQNTSRVERGAFLRAAYVPRRKQPDLPPRRGVAVKKAAFGFPVAIERRLESLEPDGVLSTRDIVFPKDSFGDTMVTGIPVFWPGGANPMDATNPPPDGLIGYLPDPAADIYVVRLRRRGTRMYLAGYREIDIYPKTQYPNAIPLALDVKQRRETNPRPTRVEDIVSSPRLKHLDKAGVPRDAASAETSPVQVVEITLGPYEDYDVDVVCLPTWQRFALEFAMPETIAQQLPLMPPNADVGLGKTAEDFAKDIKAAEAGTVGYTGLLGQQAAAPYALEPVAKHLLNVYRNSWPLEEIAAAMTFRVCHARNAPETVAAWIGPIAIKRESIAASDQAAFTQNQSVPEVLVDAKIELDLSQIDAFEIVARIPAADGSPMDDPKRKRSALSLRSGRWPRRLSNAMASESVPTATENPIPVRDVYGFDVFADHTVRLTREEVVLLRVANLPQPGTYGDFHAVSKVRMLYDENKDWLADRKEPLKDLFKVNGKRVVIDLNQLFKAAIHDREIVYNLAQPNQNVRDRAAKPIRLTIERPYRIKDALARGIELRVVGIGRQSMLFETAPVYLKDPDQSYFRRQALKAKDQSITSPRTPATLFVPGTRRPDSCRALRPEPAFQFVNAMVTTQDGRVDYEVTRHAMCRIWLDRSWATSGEGERLGLVLWPPNYRDQKFGDLDKDRVRLPDRKELVAIGDFEDQDIGEAGAFITRWGGDPTRRDNAVQTGFLIPPEALRDLKRSLSTTSTSPHKPGYIKEISMPMARRANSTATAQETASPPAKAKELTQFKVSLLTYEPCFDPDREQWYVDIDIEPNRASEPFVRFGLVRYQPNADREFQVSEPVSVMMQVLAGRQVIRSVSADDDGGFVASFRVKGRGAAGIPAWSGNSKEAAGEASETWLKTAAELEMPKLRTLYFHEYIGEDGSLRRRPLAQTNPNDGSGEHSATFSGDDVCFDFECRFSKDEIAPLAGLGKGLIVAYLEEVHRFMPASYRREPITLDTMFDRRTFVDSGPRFSARVEILDIGYAETPPPGAIK
jgi:hypothetical protein